MTEARYKRKYTYKGHDGHYYWKEAEEEKIVNKYWIGPYNVRVPVSVSHVVANDGYNTMHRDGGVTEKFCHGVNMTEEKYKNLYTVLGNDGHYYWKTKE